VKILILEILHVFLRLKFSSALTLTKLKRFESGSSSLKIKRCFPIESDKGLYSEVFGHFGTAPNFIAFDTDTKTISTINNQDLGHAHGNCGPLKALDGKVAYMI